MKGTPPLGTMGPMVAPGAPIEEAEVRAAIETYTVNLVKAIFQASFFRTQHDLTLKAVDAFLESAVVLGDRFEEITYMASSVETKPEIVVEGLGPEAVPLRSCLRSSLRDEFIGKLHDFFGWNGLVSLSIRRDVRRADLLEFLERTARTSIVPAGAAGAMEPRRHFSDVLAERGIVGITAIRRDDVVFGERVLPWRVRLALARLRKSLRSIPLYARATAQQIREAKVLVLGDIVRPLQRRELLTELLVNCDLVETCGTELEGMDVAWEVAQAVARPRLLVVAAFLAEELERPAATGGPESARRDRLLGAFRTCLACASTVVDDELVALTRNALRLGWLRQDELADNVREYLDLERLAEQFLADPGMHVRRIRETSDAKGFRAFSSTAPILVRELAQRGQYGWVAAIAGALEDQATGKTPAEPEVRSLARAALEGLTPPALVEKMLADLETADGATQQQILFVLRREPARFADLFLRCLAGPAGDTARAAIRLLLEQVGAVAVEPVRAALREADRPPEFYRDLLLVLGRLPGGPLPGLSGSFLRHESAEVRQAALFATAAAGGPAVECLLLDALDDEDIAVQAMAVRYLGERGCRNEAFLRFIEDLLAGSGEMTFAAQLRALVGGKEARTRMLVNHLRLLTAAVVALAKRLEREEERDVERAERRLVALLGRELDSLQREPSAPEAVERKKLCAAVVGVLRVVGTENSLATLGRARQVPEREVGGAAAAAVREIMARRGVRRPLGWGSRLWCRIRRAFGGWRDRRPVGSPARGVAEEALTSRPRTSAAGGTTRVKAGRTKRAASRAR